MSELITQNHKGHPVEVTVTHSELSEVLICSEHRTDMMPADETGIWPVRKEKGNAFHG